MIIDDVATQANILLIHHPDAITDFFLLALGIKDPWYIKSLDMVPSAKNPEILEMRVEVDLLEGSKVLKTSTTVYIQKRKKTHERMMIPFLHSVSAPFTLEKIQERR